MMEILLQILQKKMDYTDEQKKKALENILWYKRKEPKKFFYKK